MNQHEECKSQLAKLLSDSAGWEVQEVARITSCTSPYTRRSAIAVNDTAPCNRLITINVICFPLRFRTKCSIHENKKESEVSFPGEFTKNCG
jgi:hypothetical protein